MTGTTHWLLELTHPLTETRLIASTYEHLGQGFGEPRMALFKRQLRDRSGETEASRN